MPIIPCSQRFDQSGVIHINIWSSKQAKKEEKDRPEIRTD